MENEIIGKILGLLEQLIEEKGVPADKSLVDKNIVKSENSPLDNGAKKRGGLKPSDRKTLVETFT